MLGDWACANDAPAVVTKMNVPQMSQPNRKSINTLIALASFIMSSSRSLGIWFTRCSIRPALICCSKKSVSFFQFCERDVEDDPLNHTKFHETKASELRVHFVCEFVDQSLSFFLFQQA